MTMKLYEIDKQLANLLEYDTERMVDTESGELLTADQVDALKMERSEKLEGCLLYYKNMAAEAEAIDLEIKRLTDRKKAAKNKAEWIKNYVANSLAGEKFSTPKVAVSYRKSEAVDFDDSYLLDVPAVYLKIHEPELDKTAVKKAIKAGDEVPGCCIVTKQNIQIK